MAGGRSNNTMEEMLTRVLQDLSVAMTTPDADLQFLSNLMAAITKKLREPDEMLSQMQQQGGAGPVPQGGPPQGPPPGMNAQGGGVPGGGLGGGVPGVMSSPTTPNPDELRRMMGS